MPTSRDRRVVSCRHEGNQSCCAGQDHQQRWHGRPHLYRDHTTLDSRHCLVRLRADRPLQLGQEGRLVRRDRRGISVGVAPELRDDYAHRVHFAPGGSEGLYPSNHGGSTLVHPSSCSPPFLALSLSFPKICYKCSRWCPECTSRTRLSVGSSLWLSEIC